MFGVTPTGINVKRLADSLAELKESLRAELGDSLNVEKEAPFGQIAGIVAELDSKVWELGEALYNNQYIKTATGISLDNAVALIGIKRKEPTKSTVAIQKLFGTVSTLVPAGTVFSVSGNSAARFATDADVTLVAGNDEVQTITFSGTPTSGSFKITLDDETTSAIDWNDNAATIQAELRAFVALVDVTVTGSFAAGFVVTFTGADGIQSQTIMTTSENTLDDGGAVTIVVTETTPGVSQGEASMTAEIAGDTVAPARSLTVIETAVSGLTSGKNSQAAVTGQNLETDTELKIRAETSTQISGNATVEAIRSEMLKLSGVTSATVFENETDATDGAGRPPHSIEAVVLGGDEQEIADKLWETKGGGIPTVSTAAGGDNISKTVTDSQGVVHTINFSRPTTVLIYLDFTLTVDSATYPADGDAQVELSAISYGDSLGVGDDVIVYPALIAAISGIVGITDVVTDIGIAPGPSGDANVTISATEIASFLAANITVTS